MEPFIPALVVFTVGVVVGAVAWHFVHASVKQKYAVAQNDVAWLKSEIARLQAALIVPAPASVSVAAPVEPAPAPAA